MPSSPHKLRVILSKPAQAGEAETAAPPGGFCEENLSSLARSYSSPKTMKPPRFLSLRAKRGICFSLAACCFALAALLSFAPAAFSPPKRPSISGIAFVRVSVSSLEAAKKFYADVLGLPPIDQCLGGSAAQCFFIKPLQELQITQLDNPQRKDLVDAVGILTADAATLREYLVASGADPGKLESQPNGAPFFEISDPEGHQLVFVSARGAAGSIPGGDRQVSKHLIHAGIVVHDRAAEDHFYKDILGFHVYWHGGMKEDETNWVDMQVPDGTDWIEYMLNVPADASHRLLGVMNHIALGVPDIHAAEQQLLKNGMKLAEEPKIGRDGKWQLNLYDPDQTRVELMEFTPSRKPCCSEYTGPHPKP